MGKRKKRSLEKEFEGLEKEKVNKALAIAFVTIVGLLTLPLVAASATGDIAVFDGKVGILAGLAFFTAAYAIILIHATLGRD